MMDFYQGQEALLQQASRIVETETVPLNQAAGRILAQSIIATTDSPAFDNSAMDGYAICGLDCAEWQLTDTAAAGDTRQLTLQHGQAMRIYTGAGIPVNTDAVIMQENTCVEGLTLSCTSTPVANENIRRQGEELKQGATLLEKGALLNTQAIGLAASQGFSELQVYQKLRVSVFTTGDELVSGNSQLQQHQIYDSNRPMLLACLQTYTFIEIIDGGILPDNLDIITETLSKAATGSHSIIISGGASVGDRDLVKPALQQLGSIEHWKLAIKPGKPFGWGCIGECRVMLLPGNPVASFVTFKLLGLPALQTAAGRHILQALPECYQAKAAFSITPNRQKRREFLRGTLRFTNNGPEVIPLNKQGSHMLSSCVNAQVLIDIPAQTDIQQGQWLTVYPI
ncbi:molybdopterin molybdotransferase MoeA [Snodgrassella alvi]|uniref:molybdopterin molybdotransferase MoeA n=1 Tax=Snodgrassella alvi TaxID=1196083 RepID=UPI0027423C7C|nr:gephyrin-like molybdotransferase Glp [Snodgrassella alvi]WLT03038.1 molybdopterin molybdotransferase MoeA [Snodgrassella alvi]